MLRTTRSASTAFFTDEYEVLNLQGAIRSGVADHEAVFEVFSRRLPKGRRYGVVAGLGRLLRAIEEFRFGEEEVNWLREQGIGDEATWAWLSGRRFSGRVIAYPEGETYFPYSPVLRVEGSFGECILLETLVLSILNWDSQVATSASRMVKAAAGRPLIEMGSRRIDEEAAVAAGRAACIAGFIGTSNLEAGRRFGVPTKGTAAHAFVMAHRDEKEAFLAQIETQGKATTLLVDTYDIAQGIRNAIQVAGTELGGVRIDSGDPRIEVPRARALLDSLGAVNTRIVLSGGLGEKELREYAELPVGGYGVGEKLVSPGEETSPGFVYKLVAIQDEPGAEMRQVAKKSSGKASYGGAKWAYRQLDPLGRAISEEFSLEPHPVGAFERQLQVLAMEGGVTVWDPSLEEIQERHRSSLAELPEWALELDPGEPALIVQPAGAREALGVGV